MARPRQSLLEPIQEEASVREPGQRLVQRLVLEPILERLSLADVPRAALKPDHRAALVADRSDQRLEPHELARRVAHSEGGTKLSTGLGPGQGRLDLLPVIGVAELIGVTVYELFRRDAEQRHGGRAGVEELAVEIVECDEVAAVVGEEPVQVLPLAQRPFCLPEVRDLLPERDERRSLLRPILSTRHVPEEAAVSVSGKWRLEAAPLAAPSALLEEHGDGGVLLLRNHQLEKPGSERALPRWPVETLRLPVPFQDGPRRGDQDEGPAGLLDPGEVPRLRLANRSERRLPPATVTNDPGHSPAVHPAKRDLQRVTVPVATSGGQLAHPAALPPELRDDLRLHSAGLGRVEDVTPVLAEQLVRAREAEEPGARLVHVDEPPAAAQKCDAVGTLLDRRQSLLERPLCQGVCTRVLAGPPPLVETESQHGQEPAEYDRDLPAECEEVPQAVSHRTGCPGRGQHGALRLSHGRLGFDP